MLHREKVDVTEGIHEDKLKDFRTHFLNPSKMLRYIEILGAFDAIQHH